MAISKGLRTLMASAALALAASTASAGIIPFTISGSYSQGTGLGDLGGCGTGNGISISLGGAGSFELDPGCSDGYFDMRAPGGGTFSTDGSQIDGYYFLRSYAAGDVIGLGNFGFDVSDPDDWDSILVGDATMGAWNASHSGFLGFNTSAGLFGWIEYQYTRADGVSTLEFLRGAYNDSAREDIIAGDGVDVPEPAPLALLLAGLFAAVGLRRRQSR